MKCYKVISLILSILLLTNVICINYIEADEALSSITISSSGEDNFLAVLESDNKVYVSLDEILPYSDYVSNSDGTLLSMNNGPYHKIKIDYSNKTLMVGNFTWKFSNLINNQGIWYFPLSEICSWVNLNLGIDGDKLIIAKDPYSLWYLFNTNNFEDYLFNYTKEAGDNIASSSLIFISYMANTIINIKDNWSRLTRINPSDATVSDYSTILEKAILESMDFKEIVEKQTDSSDFLGDYTETAFDLYYSNLEKIMSNDQLKTFEKATDISIDGFTNSLDVFSDLFNSVVYINDLKNINDDYRNMLDIVYSSSYAEPSKNEKKAASHINDKYSGEVHDIANAALIYKCSEWADDLLFMSSPMEQLFICTETVNFAVSTIFPNTSNIWDDVSLIPALTKAIGTNNKIINMQQVKARNGNYEVDENERLRLSTILFLRLCRIGYEMMMNAGVGSKSYYQDIIDEIDLSVTKLHLARNSMVNDSVDDKQTVVNSYDALLSKIKVSSNNDSLTYVNKNEDKSVSNNNVLSRFNYLVENVYKPGDIHFENKKSWPHGGYQCYGFAREVFYQLFGTTFPDLDTNKYYVFKENQSDIKNVKVIGQLIGSQITIENVKTLLSYAKVGDIIQMANGANNRYHHTMVVGRYIYDDGLEIYENNWSPYMTELSKHTWRGICNYTGSYSNSGITLYRASNYEDISGEIDLGGIYIPPSSNDTSSGNSSQIASSNNPTEVSVSFGNIYALQSSTNPLDITFYCDEINASNIGTFSEWGLTVWQGDNEIASVKDHDQSWKEDHMSTWFNSLKYNISLKENIEYKFRFYVVFDNNTYYSDVVTYKTAAKQDSGAQNNLNTDNNIKFSNQYAKQNGTDPTDVTFYCDNVQASAVGVFSEWGLTILEGDKEIKTVKDTGQSWKEDHMNIWFNSKKYGISLKADTEYKYRFYVVYNNATSYGEVQYYTTGSTKSQETPETKPNPIPAPTPNPEPADSISFSNLYASQNGDNPLDVTFYCDSIKANKTGDFTEWGLTIWLNGSEIITVKDTNQAWREDHMNTWFNSIKYGINLSADTDYSFTFYVVFNGNKYNSDAAYFRTGSQSQKIETTKSVSFSNQYVSQNGSDPTDVTFYCDSIKASCLGTFSEWGVLVFDSNGNQIGAGRDVDQAWYENHMNTWFNSKKYNISLSSGTFYQYQFFVIFDSKLYYSDIQSFTTNS